MKLNTLIVGGGHAGVNLASMLALEKPSEAYLVLERAGALLPKWRTSRWEGFQLNTPVKFSRLYGEQIIDEREDDHWLLDRTLEEDLKRWDAHIARLKIQHKLHSNVVKVTRDDNDNDDDGSFTTTVEETNPKDQTKHIVEYKSKNVVVCNGYFDQPKTPTSLADNIPSHIKQHVVAGFRLRDLKEGNVLIVGSGQSGVQIADILLRQRRRPELRLYMATSAVPGCPRSFRGRDLFDWLDEMNFLGMPRAALESMPPEKARAMRYNKTPVTGPTKDISPFSLHRQGVELLGKLDHVEEKDGKVLFQFQPDRCQNLKTCYDGYANFMNAIKAHAKQPDAPDAPEWSNLEAELLEEPGLLTLDADEAKIANVIWCTGWSHDFSWLQVDHVRDKDFDAKTNAPDLIVSKTAPGLFYCGFPWIGTLQSVNLVNFNHDARIIMENLR